MGERSVAEIYAGAMIGGLPKFDGGESLDTAEIVEIKSETMCEQCGGELSRGNMFMQKQGTDLKFHIGCAESAGKNNPALKLLLKPKSWPPQRFAHQR